MNAKIRFRSVKFALKPRFKLGFSLLVMISFKQNFVVFVLTSFSNLILQ